MSQPNEIECLRERIEAENKTLIAESAHTIKLAQDIESKWPAIQRKVEAFDDLATALTNRWHDGRWSWSNPTPSGGPMRDTREEAILDLIEWAKKTAPKKRFK